MNQLKSERLRELMRYDPETGLFTRLQRASQAHPGSVAGSVGKRGYLVVSIDKVFYYGHRLAWFYMTGNWPVEKIDHRNGLRSDNRFANLREADNRLNAQNQRSARANNTTGFLGVSRNRKSFIARIEHQGTKRFIGTFTSPEEAHAAYVQVKREIHPGGTL